MTWERDVLHFGVGRGQQGAGRVAEGISGCVGVMGALVHIYCPLQELSYFMGYLLPHTEPFCSCQGSSHRVQTFHPLFYNATSQTKQLFFHPACMCSVPHSFRQTSLSALFDRMILLFLVFHVHSATLKCIPEALEKPVPSPLALTIASCTPDMLPSVEGLPGLCVLCVFICDSSALHSSWPWSWVWYPHGSPLPTGPST